MSAARRPLPQLLGDARRWFDDALLAALREADAIPVTHTQLQLFAVLDEEGTTVSELARRMAVTRQTAHQAVHALIAAGLLEQAPAPASTRRRLIRRTSEGERAHRLAEEALARLEAHLAHRLGGAAVDALRTALEADWGTPDPARVEEPAR
ncbi:MarR family winged helix-turn-helix transcriptional regulator [Streptomyces minutiscleroticus]|nr:MarR family transcriptional regulator [Streptomyces minutiscleroticus]